MKNEHARVTTNIYSCCGCVCVMHTFAHDAPKYAIEHTYAAAAVVKVFELFEHQPIRQTGFVLNIMVVSLGTETE